MLDRNEPLPVEVKSTLVFVWQFLTVRKEQEWLKFPSNA